MIKSAGVGERKKERERERERNRERKKESSEECTLVTDNFAAIQRKFWLEPNSTFCKPVISAYLDDDIHILKLTL